MIPATSARASDAMPDCEAGTGGKLPLHSNLPATVLHSLTRKGTYFYSYSAGQIKFATEVVKKCVSVTPLHM